MQNQHQMAFISELIKPRWRNILLSVIQISISLSLLAIKPFSERSTAWEKNLLFWNQWDTKQVWAVNTGKDHPGFDCKWYYTSFTAQSPTSKQSRQYNRGCFLPCVRKSGVFWVTVGLISFLDTQQWWHSSGGTRCNTQPIRWKIEIEPEDQ